MIAPTVQDDPTTVSSTRPGDPTCECITRTLSAGLISGVCEVMDPVGAVHESCVLGLEDEKRRFFFTPQTPGAARLLCEDFETTRE